MKNQKSFLCILFAALFFCSITQMAFAQDATKVDSAHYKVEFENDQLRIIRVTYAPGEKSNMHEHSEGVVVAFTDARSKVTLPDGTTQEFTVKAGQAAWVPSSKHKIENISGKPYEGLFIEMKAKPAKTKKY